MTENVQKSATVIIWKNVANFKCPILIGRQPDVSQTSKCTAHVSKLVNRHSHLFWRGFLRPWTAYRGPAKSTAVWAKDWKGKGITVLVSSSVLLRGKLQFLRGWILSKHYTAELEYVRPSAWVQVSPQQSDMGTVCLLNLYLEVHFFYVPSDTNRVSTKTDKHVEKILL